MNAGTRKMVFAAAGLAVTAMLATGCSSDDSSANEDYTRPTTGAEADALTAFEAKVDADVAAAMGSQPAVPPTAGPAAATGKRILVVPCLAASEGCSRDADAAVEAAETLGWESDVIDGGYSVDKWAAAIRQGVSQKYDGILLTSIDADAVKGPLEEAKKAGIPVVCGACTNANGLLNGVAPNEDLAELQGYLMGQYMYQLTDGNLNALMFTNDQSGFVKLRRFGTEKFVEDCKAAGGNCTITEKAFTTDQLGASLASLAASTVQVNPNANIVWVGYDSASPAVVQGLRTAGRSELRVVGFDANSETAEMIRREQGQVASMGLPLAWIGYAEVDMLNRLFAGEELVDENVPTRLLTKENLPSSGPWNGDVDFSSNYETIWGK